jgi:hypothetical protein
LRKFEKKAQNRTEEEDQIIIHDFMQIFAEFGQMMSLVPGTEKVQLQVKKLQDYISEHFYHCTKNILRGLGKMYSGGEFTENIDKVGGRGTADFVAEAIEIYCK